MLPPREFQELGISRRVLDSLGETASSIDLGEPLELNRFIRKLVDTEIGDVIQATETNIEAAGVRDLADLRSQGDNMASYSAEVEEENRELRRFLYDYLYRHHRVMRMQARADLIVRSLFSSFIDEPALLPPQTQRIITEAGRDLHRVVCDHIAGMTDRYAIAEYRRLFDPEEVV
ncbi:MAG: hypothetical protein OXK78_00645 [Caldilineaceae bacterium]|nr:hypothetical protein [Caldilineaceae bacterium]